MCILTSENVFVESPTLRIMVRKLRHTFFILVLTMSLAFGQTAPNFTMTDVQGNEHRLYEDYLDQGKTVVFKFFFSTCGLCHNLAPSMQDLYEEWGEGEYDVEFFAITIDPSDNDGDVEWFDNQHDITYPSISSEGGAIEVYEPFKDDDFGISEQAAPAAAVIAPDGTVVYDIFGGIPSSFVELLELEMRDTGALPPSEITSVDEAPELFEELIVTPNPAQDFATVNFTLNEPANVNVQIYNIVGQSVMEIFDGTQYPGYHQLEVDAARLRPGIYFVRVMANDEVRTMRFAKAHKRP